MRRNEFPDVDQRSEKSAREPDEHGEPIVADVDLASRWLGASVIATSDESFGEKENLLKPEPAVFESGRYGNRGEIVDGWETKRRREAGNDWAIVRLGTPGVINSVDVDTSFFTGNFPESCAMDACGCEGYPGPQELVDPAVEWSELLPRAPLRGDAHNVFPISDRRRFTHVRLSIFPDGGVARLRLLGRPLPDPRLFDGLTIDLASQEIGSAVVASSDGFYTSATLLNRPDSARTMGEGWETRRRRDAGHDFAIFKLALAGRIRQMVVDTAHFKYNASAEIAAFGASVESLQPVDSAAWFFLARARLQPDTRHVIPIVSNALVATVRLDAYPDGGISRVRLIGAVDGAARRLAGYRWFNALPVSQASRCLASEGVPADVARQIVSRRPLAEGWREEILAEAPAVAGRDDMAPFIEATATVLEGPSDGLGRDAGRRS